MTDDTELLRLYVEQRSEGAFSSLVRRHVDMVYSSALRQTGGRHHLAQGVTQMVFSDLARKAATLVSHPVLPAWLHRGCRLSTLDLLRRERRRQNYEAAAGWILLSQPQGKTPSTGARSAPFSTRQSTA